MKKDIVALITGAGAIENAWSPIIKLLEDHPRKISDSDSANCFLTRFIYLLRFYAAGKSPNSKITLKELLEDFEQLKDGICKALIFAEEINMIKPRVELDKILHQFLFSKTENIIFLTTNWDLVLDNYINKIAECDYPGSAGKIIVHHIHGSANSSNGLYLPSEIIDEPYRSEKENQEMGINHHIAMQTLRKCNKIILYGLSIDPLDAELSQVLAVGMSTQNMKEVIVVNPDHKKICQRVKLLIAPEYNVKVNGYCPSNLNKKFTYL